MVTAFVDGTPFVSMGYVNVRLITIITLEIHIKNVVSIY